MPTRGIRTTYGSPIYRDNVPDQDALVVERLRAAGAITIGKTNTPEFGAGSQTFNAVFGRTLNPYDLEDVRRLAAAAPRSRWRAAWCRSPMGATRAARSAIRPDSATWSGCGAAGRVPPWPTHAPWGTLHVAGPMARTVADVALMLSAMAGPDRRSPVAIGGPARGSGDLGRDFKGVRIAWSRDLGGLPVDRRVTKVLDAQRPTFEALGCRVEDGAPDCADARQIFQVQRALSFAARYGRCSARIATDEGHGHLEHRRGARSSPPARSARPRSSARGSIIGCASSWSATISCYPGRAGAALRRHQPYVTEINGERLSTYIDWMRVCSDITVTGLPAISVPAGFTDEGLPVGLQIVGRHQDEWACPARACLRGGDRLLPEPTSAGRLSPPRPGARARPSRPSRRGSCHRRVVSLLPEFCSSASRMRRRLPSLSSSAGGRRPA